MSLRLQVAVGDAAISQCRSRDSDKAISVSFENHIVPTASEGGPSKGLDMAWVSCDGVAEPCGPLARDATTSMSTFISHPFLFRVPGGRVCGAVSIEGEPPENDAPITVRLSINAQGDFSATLVAPYAPAQIAAIAGPPPSDLRSVSYARAILLTVHNCTPDAMTVQWIDYDGVVDAAGKQGLKPSHAWSTSTFESHAFTIVPTDASRRAKVPPLCFVVVSAEGASEIELDLVDNRQPSAALWLRPTVSDRAVISVLGHGVAPPSQGHAAAAVGPAVAGDGGGPFAVLARDIVYDPPVHLTAVGFEAYLQSAMPCAEKAAVIDALKADCETIAHVVPPRALDVLRRAHVYVNHRTFYGDAARQERFRAACRCADGAVTTAAAETHLVDGAGGCLHWSAGWLIANGNVAFKEGHIEFYSAEQFLSSRSQQPMALLHEHAHGYERRLSDANLTRRIDTTFAEVVLRAGLYLSVEFTGQPDSKHKAYAATNPREYFAETTEAFFGVNDYFPFHRQQLKEYDPAGYEVIRDAWGVKYGAPAVDMHGNPTVINESPA